MVGWWGGEERVGMVKTYQGRQGKARGGEGDEMGK